jgi:alpha-1,3-mannosyltransferase
LIKLYERAFATTPSKRWIVVLLCISRRVHSIFMLRCFNDCFAMTFAYAGVLALLYSKNKLGVLLLSLGISVKMNVLLMLPGVLLVLSRSEGFLSALWHLCTFVIYQLAIGGEFIVKYPEQYFGKAFEFSRVFFFKWSVNWKFLGEELALSPSFAKLCLALHLSLLIYFLFVKWTTAKSFFRDTRLWPLTDFSFKEVHPEYTARVIFISNFIGILCSRSLHYQFYSWYFHTLPFLLWSVEDSIPFLKAIILITIEVCWNVFPPSTPFSIMLFSCHILILVGLLNKEKESHVYLQPRVKVD